MKLSAMFGDHMVLQQGLPVPIWGWAEPAEKIAVTLAGQTVRGVAKPDGTWWVTLAPLKAGGPFDLQVEGGASRTVLTDVLVGEVWLASGQSNMELPMYKVRNAEQEIFGAACDTIRLFTVSRTVAVEPARDVDGRWSVCSPTAAGNFSSAAYFFGRELQRELRVPVGLIHASYGGSPAEAWTRRAELVALPAFRETVERYEREFAHFPEARAQYEAELNAIEETYYPSDPGNLGLANGWALPDADVADWKPVRVPCYWREHGLNFNGVVWFRRDVDIPPAWAGRELRLNLCPCDKYDTTYFNNVEVGAMGRENPESWRTPRAYSVPAGLAQAGRNTVAVRIFSHHHAGGPMGSSADLSIGPADAAEADRLYLFGEWLCRAEHVFGKVIPREPEPPLGPGNPHTPCGLFNGMIAPLIPYALRGVIWYQGESNVARAADYPALFSTLIESWRKAWGQGAFPFLFVQLANYMSASEQPGESQWAELREAQAATLRTPHTGMAVAIDIGDAADIHPANKQDVGKRLALNALSRVYGFKDVVPSGPLLSKAVRGGADIRLRFAFADGGLVAQGGALKGFALAGEDGRFFWARAEIEGDTVVVSSARVPNPVAVRYAWADNPVCNLYNRAGLPASPFRASLPPLAPRREAMSIQSSETGLSGGRHGCTLFEGQQGDTL